MGGGGGWVRDPAIAAHDARLAARVCELEQMPLGATLLAGLIALTPMSMDGSTAVRVTALWDRFIAFAQAQSMIAVAEAIRSGDLPAFYSGPDAVQLIGEELAAATHTSFSTAMNRIGLVTQVGRALPLSWEALDRGELSLTHLKALAAQTECCPPRLAAAVEARVIPEAISSGWTPHELGTAAARVILALDPDGAAERATSTTNLHPLCRRHHNLKTLKLWTVVVHPDRSETWTSALGFTYHKPAATYPTELLDPPPLDLTEDLDPYQLQETDPDPPSEDIPLPEPPPITDAEYEAFTDAIEQRCYNAANTNYDSWRNLGLVS